MADNEWQERTGVSEDTVRVPIVCKEDDRETWTKEAEKNGYQNRSRYLYDLIQEARAYRQEGFLSRERSEERIEKLEAEIAALENRVEREEKKQAGEALVDDPAFVKRFLTTNYRRLPDILQDIVESGALDGIIRKKVEDQLYYLAQRDEITYERGWGWKLTDGNGGDA